MLTNIGEYWKNTKAAAVKSGVTDGLLIGLKLVTMGVDAGITRATNAFKKTGSYTLPDLNGKKYGKVRQFIDRVKLTKINFFRK